MIKLFFIALLMLNTFQRIRAQVLGGNIPSIKWKQINTTKSKIIFPPGLDSQANRLSNLVQLLDHSTVNTIGGKHYKWNIVLLNQTTIPNAYVRLAPVMSELNMTPGQDNFSTGSIRWDDNLIIHEDRHMQQLSNFNEGLTKVFSFFLGQEGQLLANGMVIPDYFFEGDAVWQETLVSAQGRGRMPLFYNSLRSLWLADKNYSWMKLRSGSLKDFTPDHYELGYQLVAYGYEKYGLDFWKKVTQDAVRFKGLFYAYNKAIERYSGKSYKDFGKDALQFFKERSLPAAGKNPSLHYVTGIKKNDVVDYLFPAYMSDDTIVVTKKSYKENNSFYLLSGGRQQFIRVKDRVLDDYFSYNNGKIVYAAFRSDPRWGNRNYSVIQLIDIHTKKQRQVSFRSKYFSPDISHDGTEILAVHAGTDGRNFLHLLNVSTGALIKELPNPHNYFFTQTKYIDHKTAVSAVRNPEGKMCLVTIDLETGETDRLTPFSFNVIGYPFVRGDTIYFSAMNGITDKIFAVGLHDRSTAFPRIFQLTNAPNGAYQPAVNTKGEMVFTTFTASGYRLVKADLHQFLWQPVTDENFTNTPDLYTPAALKQNGAGILYALADSIKPVTNYHPGFHLFNFHSWRPEVADPEYRYHFYNDNILSSLTGDLYYTYNRGDRSHAIGFNETYAGLFPFLSAGVEYGLNRSIDTALGKSVQFNSAKINLGISIPLSFTGSRTSTFLNFGAGYNIEQLYYRGIGKNVFDNKALKYGNAFFSFSNANRQARQHINPRWAQTVSLSYRDAFTFVNSHKFVANSSFYFPGLSTNHSLVINASFQKRDSLADLFSNNFSYSRGYEALSTRQMYKLGVNYHFPLLYPDWGFGNIIFFQRIRANAFYDHTVARARVNRVLTDIINRSTGAEIYFDTKVWNALPVSFGVRYSYLLDTDLRNRGVKNRWEFIVPINFIPD